MAGFGGAIKLTGETEYKRALMQINQSLRETASEMKVVASSYSANDRSQSAVTAKTEVLNKKLEQQQQKVAELKAQYQAFSQQASEQTSKHEALTKEYENEKQKLDEIGKTLGTTSQEYQDQEQKVTELEKAVIESSQAEEDNQKAMSKMRTEINNAQADCNKTSQALDQLGDSADDASEEATKAGDGFSVFKMVIANLATQAINMAIDALKRLATALINVGKQALEGYAEYEQLVGGVETLFKDSAPIVQQYAENAYKTAGMSANEYMQTVTGFSASLISSLDGDTAKSAEVADRAIRDMSDNANKMGTDITSIQNAYQGFAKQNYTLLDNLKLGYGGTKTEMERLISDASEMTDVQKELGIEVDKGDMSFANIANAISVVQKKMGIMGTTAKEADSTIEGSVNSLKASWSNLVTGIADETVDLDKSMQQFADSLVTALKNVVPRIFTIIQGMAKVAGDLIKEYLPQVFKEFAPTIMYMFQDLAEQIPPFLENLSAKMSEYAPKVAELGANLLIKLGKGFLEALPQLMSVLGNVVNALLKIIVGIPAIMLSKGLLIMGKFALGLLKGINGVVKAGAKIVKQFLNSVKSLPSKLLAFGLSAIKSLASGISKGASTAIGKAKALVTRIKDSVKNGFSNLGNVGLNLVKGIWNGISNGTSWIKGKIRSWVGNVTSFLKHLFGIQSPSKLYRDEIGKNLALGIGVGFSDEMKHVSRVMGDSIPQSMDSAVNGISGARYANDAIQDTSMVKAFKQALGEMQIVLDDQVAGHFVDKTVTRLIYA